MVATLYQTLQVWALSAQLACLRDHPSTRVTEFSYLVNHFRSDPRVNLLSKLDLQATRTAFGFEVDYRNMHRLRFHHMQVFSTSASTNLSTVIYLQFTPVVKCLSSPSNCVIYIRVL
ncbi:hypothetical protein HBI56_125160 [Parastagonospora nodorum]|nr:hypothetical protein HBI06_157670 [Parastagonospora nodorum]KAH4248910.1 hypothetical protein HBI05_025990 [Parastagonospora nodorum]KAH5153173.1 hypothetical protein HBH69_128950 [Parastagonospora nodorum]KAH5409372.1 hypothetical protein HBI46_173310 [Parastagonospora nodorum]KAH6126496.1 hypothetical protein HBI64_135410 [Parastagonospora nodorum]